MIRIKWPLALATLFLMLLGWWLFYTQEVVQRVEENSALMAEMFAELQEGVLSQDLTSRTRALVNVQEIVRRTGLHQSDRLVQSREQQELHLLDRGPEDRQRLGIPPHDSKPIGRRHGPQVSSQVAF